MQLTIYLAGQVHDDWRERFAASAKARGLPLTLVGPQPEHDLSDAIGETILGEQPSARWKDEVASQMNNLRTRIMMQRADAVIACFGDKYRQWNAAFDAGYAAALGKPLIVLHPPEHGHALKEVDATTAAVAETPEQVVAILDYVTTGQLTPKGRFGNP